MSSKSLKLLCLGCLFYLVKTHLNENNNVPDPSLLMLLNYVVWPIVLVDLLSSTIPGIMNS